MAHLSLYIYPPCLPSERGFDVQISLEKTGAILSVSQCLSLQLEALFLFLFYQYTVLC